MDDPLNITVIQSTCRTYSISDNEIGFHYILVMGVIIFCFQFVVYIGKRIANMRWRDCMSGSWWRYLIERIKSYAWLLPIEQKAGWQAVWNTHENQLIGVSHPWSNVCWTRHEITNDLNFDFAACLLVRGFRSAIEDWFHYLLLLLGGLFINNLIIRKFWNNVNEINATIKKMLKETCISLCLLCCGSLVRV